MASKSGLKREDFERARSFMRRRRSFRARFPFKPETLYFSLLSEEERKAIDTVVSSDNLGFQYSSQMEVMLDLGKEDLPGSRISGLTGRRTYKFVASLPTPLPKMRTTVAVGSGFFEPLVEWAIRWNEATQDLNNVMNTLDTVREWCRTPAEFLRLWPAMAKISFPAVRRPAIMTLRVKMLVSKVYSDEELLKHMARAEEMVAEGMLLPEAGDSKDIAYID